jgi:hypothetical protein
MKLFSKNQFNKIIGSVNLDNPENINNKDIFFNWLDHLYDVDHNEYKVRWHKFPFKLIKEDPKILDKTSKWMHGMFWVDMYYEWCELFESKFKRKQILEVFRNEDFQNNIKKWAQEYINENGMDEEFLNPYDIYINNIIAKYDSDEENRNDAKKYLENVVNKYFG